MDYKKLKGNLVGTAKIYRYGLGLLISMVAVDAYRDDFEDTLFFLSLIIGYVPILVIKVILYTYVENLEFHKLSKGLLWSFLSSNVIFIGISLASYYEPPSLTLNEYLLYMASFTVLLFLNYFMLPWKEY